MLGTNDTKSYFRRTPYEIANGMASWLGRSTAQPGGGHALSGAEGACGGSAPADTMPHAFFKACSWADTKRLPLAAQYRAMADFMKVAFFEAGSVISTDGCDGIHFTVENNHALGKALRTRCRDPRLMKINVCSSQQTLRRSGAGGRQAPDRVFSMVPQNRTSLISYSVGLSFFEMAELGPRRRSISDRRHQIVLSGGDAFSAQRSLRSDLLDRPNIRYKPARDLAAHMLLHLDDVDRCWSVATTWLRAELGCHRVDTGFGQRVAVSYSLGFLKPRPRTSTCPPSPVGRSTTAMT